MSRPFLWCVLSALLFGASTPASKHLLVGMNPLLLAGLLYGGAALAVAPSALAKGRSFLEADRKSWIRLSGAVLFGGLIGPLLLLFGLAKAPAGSVALWLNLETVSTALLAMVFFKEHLHAKTWIAVALIVGASAILSGFSDAGLTAALLVASACVAWGLDNNLTALIDRFTPAQIVLVKGATAGALYIALGLTSTIELLDVLIALIVGALGYGLSLLLYIRGAQQLGATRSQLVFSTAPAWGLMLAWVVLGEPIGWQQLLAASMMAVAIWLWSRERHAHTHGHPAAYHTHWHRHDDEHHDHAHEGEIAKEIWHSHPHRHEAMTHEHEHRPDLHHRHDHADTKRRG